MGKLLLLAQTLFYVALAAPLFLASRGSRSTPC